MKTIILILLTCISHSAIAETYKCIQSGETVYSTSPCGDNAQVVPNHITPRDISTPAINQEPSSAQASPQTVRTAVASDFMERIHAKIRRSIIMPPDVPTNARVEFATTLSPKGYVQKLMLVKSSGDEKFDKAIKRAILKSQPLPIPTDPALFNKFRELKFVFKPPE